MEGIGKKFFFFGYTWTITKNAVVDYCVLRICWCYFGPLGKHGKERKRACTQEREKERDIFTYVGYRPSRQRSLTFKSQKVPELVVTKKELFYPSN
jgi:hypothetical protein